MTGPPPDWFAVVDTARDPGLHTLVKRSAGWRCLISGDVPPVLAAALPYVVRMRQDEPLARAWRAEGMGQAWGILLQSPLPLDAVKLHFKKFLNAKLPDGQVVLFRFYDPRVFRTYIRAATAEERASWFNGVTRYSVESDEPGRLHDFRLSGGLLYDGARALAA